ncbi:CDP-alcohol phosphatidyltransferase family protein [Patescibacteria group bacterium]
MKKLKSHNIGSNLISFIGGVTGICSAFFLFSHHNIFIILILITMSLDMVDGALSKVERFKKRGWLIDSIYDRIVTISLISAAYIHYDTLFWGIILVSFVMINAIVLYLRERLGEKFMGYHWDAVAYILFVFNFYYWGGIAISVLLILNLIIIIMAAKKYVDEFTWANLISITRPILVILALVYAKYHPWLLAGLIIIIILLDGLDGIVARKIDKKGRFGAYVDIAADRAVELIILFTYAYWGMITIAIPIIFAVRGLLTDFLRVLNNIYKDSKFKEPLSIGKADNRFIRGLYGFIKLAAFSVILILPKFGYGLIIVTLCFNLYRGLPVIFSKRSKYLFGKFFKGLLS